MSRTGSTAPPREWQERLESHLTLAMEALRECAVEGEEFHPVVVFVKPDGDEEFAILVFPREARERAIADVARQAHEGGCQGLIMVGDSWTATPASGREPRRGDAVNHPEREECLMLLLFTPNGSWGRTVHYRREGKEIIFQPPAPWFPPDSPWNPWRHVQ